MEYVVALDGSGDFTSLQAAVDALPALLETPATIYLRPGEYREKVVVNRDHVRIVGEDALTTALVYADYARMKDQAGKDIGTFQTYTLLVAGDDVAIENLTVRNDAGPGGLVGQAVAVYAAGDRGVWRNCRLIGHQDTLFCGPVTDQARNMARPRQVPEGVLSAGDCGDVYGRQFFFQCLIQGDVDFIFGPYRCYFSRCTLYMNARGGMYTAANTPKNAPYGLVFHRCALTGACAPGMAYLGRPWRAFARTVYLSCDMDACVSPQGFMDWDDQRPVTDRLGEYDTRGARAAQDTRQKNQKRLTKDEAALYTIRRVLDGWQPEGGDSDAEHAR